MTKDELKDRLVNDLKALRIPIDDVELSIRDFSSTYYGRYFPVYDDTTKPRIYIYPYKNECGELYDYDFLLDTTIHEMVHHVQYNSPFFVRKKGVMHDPQFWSLYNHYIDKAKNMNIIGGEVKVG